MTYKPTPINTDTVKLSDDLTPLLEKLAEHNHDVWSQGRIDEGWTHGAQRDDSAKTHPDLVPYGDLTESEKEYDRNSVRETLKAIVALGFKIEKG